MYRCVPAFAAFVMALTAGTGFAQTAPVTAAPAALAAAPAAAMQGGVGTEGGVYVTVGGGLTNRQRAAEAGSTYTDFESGYALNAAVGYEFDALAVEGEFSFFKNSAETVASPVTGPQEGVGDVTMRYVMANVRYSFLDTPLRPYVGGGIGFYKSYLNDLSNVVAESFGFLASGSNDGLTFAYQLRGGVQFDIAERAGVLVGYRYLRGSELLFEGTAFGDLRPDGAKVHSVEAAFKLGF